MSDGVRNNTISKLSPASADIWFKRKVRLSIPNIDHFKIKDSNYVKKGLIKRSKKQKQWYDKTAIKSENVY